MKHDKDKEERNVREFDVNREVQAAVQEKLKEEDARLGGTGADAGLRVKGAADGGGQGAESVKDVAERTVADGQGADKEAGKKAAVKGTVGVEDRREKNKDEKVNI